MRAGKNNDFAKVALHCKTAAKASDKIRLFRGRFFCRQGRSEKKMRIKRSD